MRRGRPWSALSGKRRGGACSALKGPTKVGPYVILAAFAAASCNSGVSPTPPPSTNTPPVIRSIVAQGILPREPAQYATLGEVINVSADVADAETAIDRLTFAWSARFGTFSGTGSHVTWQAPAAMATPTTVPLTV